MWICLNKGFTNCFGGAEFRGLIDLESGYGVLSRGR